MWWFGKEKPHSGGGSHYTWYDRGAEGEGKEEGGGIAR